MDVEVVELGDPAPAEDPPPKRRHWWWVALVLAVVAVVATQRLSDRPKIVAVPAPSPSRPVPPAPPPTDFTLPLINALCGNDCDLATDDPTYVDLIKQHVPGVQSASGVTVFRKGRPLGAVVLTERDGARTVYALSSTEDRLRMRPPWAADVRVGAYSLVASTDPIPGQITAFMKFQALLPESSSGDKVQQFSELICGSDSACSSVSGNDPSASAAFPGAIVREQVVRASATRSGAVFTVQQPNGRILVIGVLPAGTATPVRLHGWALRSATAGSRLILTATTGFAVLTPVQQQWAAQVPIG